MVTGAELLAAAKAVGPALLSQAKALLDSKQAKAERAKRTALAAEVGSVIVQSILAGGSVHEPLLADLIEEFERLVGNGANPRDLRHVREMIDKSLHAGVSYHYRPSAYGAAEPRGGAVRRPAAKKAAATGYGARKPAAKKAMKRPAAKKAAKRPASKKAIKRPAAKKAVTRPATKKSAKRATRQIR